MSTSYGPTSDGDLPTENGLNNRLPKKSDQENPLTCIRNAYTLAYTEEHSKLDKAIVKNFIEVLANVALSVAARKNK
jgi:hypothetical protein